MYLKDDPKFKLATKLVDIYLNPDSFSLEEVYFALNSFGTSVLETELDGKLSRCEICEVIININNEITLCDNCLELFVTYKGDLYIDYLNFDNKDSKYKLRTDLLYFPNEDCDNTDTDKINFVECERIRDMRDIIRLTITGKFLVLNYGIYKYYENRPWLKNDLYLSSDDMSLFLVFNKTRFCALSEFGFVFIKDETEIYNEIMTAAIIINRLPNDFISRGVKKLIFTFFFM